jgi:hypothetical protein
MTFEFSAPLWLHAEGSWYFVSVPAEISDDIAERTAGLRGGFGSVRVTVAVGDTTWQTSVFPDKKTGTFVLPVKKSVRTAEDLEAGDDVQVGLEIAGED